MPNWNAIYYHVNRTFEKVNKKIIKKVSSLLVDFVWPESQQCATCIRAVAYFLQYTLILLVFGRVPMSAEVTTGNYRLVSEFWRVNTIIVCKAHVHANRN